MVMPVASEAWNNTHVSGVGTGWERNRLLLFGIKQALTTGLGAWTVVSSCVGYWNPVDLKYDWFYGNTDYWTSPTGIRWLIAGERSWIVLQQAGMGAGAFQICLDLNTEGDGNTAKDTFTYVISYSGSFTGGSSAARPTAPDEWSIGEVEFAYNPGGPPSGTGGANVMKTTSGKCTRVYTSNAGGAQHNMWIIEEPKNISAWWTTPYITFIGRTLFTYANFCDLAGLRNECNDWYLTNLYSTSEGSGNNALGRLALFSTADYNGEWICGTIGLVCYASSVKGWFGDIRDMWWVSDDLAKGTYMPGDGSRDFVVLGNILQPWDRSVIIFD
jgi:hypothetical protein